MTVTPEQICPHCKAKWSWAGRYWIVADAQGRLQQPAAPTEQVQEAPKLTRCPLCKQPLEKPKGKVEEVTG